MASKISPTLKVLLEMRDELRKLNARTANVEQRLGNLETETREGFSILANEITAARGATEQVVVVLKDRRDRHGVQLADHEKRIIALEKRTRLRLT